MSHACHRFWKCYKTLTFCSLLKRCTIPGACHAKRHLNPQKWSEAEVLFCTFWLRKVLRATTACTFSTSQLPKVVRTWCVLYILTWKCGVRHRGVLYIFTSKCASRHNRVHFSDIATSKSGPRPRCFVHLTCKCASRHNGVQFFISHLASWLRTRRFSEPTFRPSGAPNQWKNTAFRDFPTFSRICIFFLLTLSLLLFFLLIFLFSPALLFICPYCRKFDFIYCLMQVQCLSPQTPASVAMCFQKKKLPRTFSTAHRDKHVGVQRITDAAVPSRRQKRQTRKSRTESDRPRVADEIWSLKQCAFIVWCKFSAFLHRLQQASPCASKKNVAPCLFYSPPTQPSIGCNRDSKIRTRDSNTSVDPSPLHPTFIYRSIYLSVCLSICLSPRLSIDQTLSLSICIFVFLSIYLSMYLSIYLSIYLGI